MNIDIPTLTLMTALGCLVMPVMTWLALMSRRDRTLDLWCLAGVVVGLGWLLASLRGHVSDWLSLVLGFVLLSGSLAIRIHALQMELGRPPRIRLLIGLVFLTGAMFAWTQWAGDHFSRGLITRLTFALGSAWIAWLAWQLGQRESSPPVRWIAASFALMSLGFFDLLLASLLNPNAPRAFGWSNYWTFTLATSMLTNILCHFGFASLVLKRERQAQVAVARRAAADEENHRLEMRLSQLGRRQHVAVVGTSLIHDLSQPLAALLIHAEVIKRGLLEAKVPVAKATQGLEKIESNAQRCYQILANTTGELLNIQEQDQVIVLATAVREAWELLEPQARSLGIHFALRENQPGVSVIGLPGQLSQIISNLLRNALDALKQQPGPRRIEVDIDLQADWAVAIVRDNGPGIPYSVRARLFEPFFSTKHTGLGLGLAICQTLLRKMNGDLMVANPPEGGTVFTVRLPSCVAAHK